MSKKPSMLEEYFDEQTKATKKYGEHTVVFMQNGTFYESYQTNELGYDLENIAELLNFMVTKKCKSKPVSISTPYMLGVPTVTWNKHLKLMVENGYTIVEIAEVTPAPNPKRELIAVHSPATYTDEITNPESNYICSIYIEEIDKMYICGVVVMDLATGKSFISESQSQKLDNMVALDDIAKIIQTYQCKEVIITSCNLVSFTKTQLIAYLEVADKLHFYSTADLHNDNIKRPKYQIEKFKESFSHVICGSANSNNNAIIEELGLESLTYVRIAFVVLLNYIKDHCEKFATNLNIPKHIEKHKYMHLGNNAINQLNIFNNDQNNTSNMYFKGARYKCLFDIINKTSTSMGRRFLKTNLINPLIDINTLNARYDIIENWYSTGKWSKLEEILKEIPDIERYCRKITVNNIHPIDLYKCIIGIENSAKLIAESDIDLGVCTMIELLKATKDCLDYVNSKIIVDNLQQYTNINGIEGQIFVEGVYPTLDVKNNEISICKNYMNIICSELNKVLNKKAPKSKKKILDMENDADGSKLDTMIKVGYTTREGHFLELTKRRCEILEDWFNNNDLQIGNITLGKKDLIIKTNPAGQTTKIFMECIKIKTEQLGTLIDKLKLESKLAYVSFLDNLSHKFYGFFNNLVSYVSEVDFLKSGAKNIVKNGYKRPMINSVNDTNKSTKAYLNVVGMRHPICEKLLTETEYVPVDINLGKDDHDGILLFGLNSAGKSTLQKAIGINLIMAQIGYFVAATKFEYKPYSNLMTRISGNDNMFKGLSSFALEANELKAIIKRSDENTIIIADEVCRGTEHRGSLTVIMTMLELLLSKKCSFITATHLHDLLQYNRINNMKNLQMYHLHLDYDEYKNIITYDRILKQGSGQSEYGFQMAKHLINDPEFTALANEINAEINGKTNRLEKPSKYNADLWMSECQICNYKPTTEQHKPLETHHINFQRDCDENNYILTKPHLHKNHKSNLCVLCADCHDKIDTGELTIYGYESTSDGNVLKYCWKKIVKIDTDTNLNKITATVTTTINMTLEDEIQEMVKKGCTQKLILEKFKGKATQVYIKKKIKEYQF